MLSSPAKDCESSGPRGLRGRSSVPGGRTSERRRSSTFLHDNGLLLAVASHQMYAASSVMNNAALAYQSLQMPMTVRQPNVRSSVPQVISISDSTTALLSVPSSKHLAPPARACWPLVMVRSARRLRSRRRRHSTYARADRSYNHRWFRFECASHHFPVRRVQRQVFGHKYFGGTSAGHQDDRYTGASQKRLRCTLRVAPTPITTYLCLTSEGTHRHQIGQRGVFVARHRRFCRGCPRHGGGIARITRMVFDTADPGEPSHRRERQNGNDYTL